MNGGLFSIPFETILMVAASIAIAFGFKYYRDHREGRLSRRRDIKREKEKKEKEKNAEQSPMMSLMVKRKPKPTTDKKKQHEELLEFASLNDKARRKGRK